MNTLSCDDERKIKIDQVWHTTWKLSKLTTWTSLHYKHNPIKLKRLKHQTLPPKPSHNTIFWKFLNVQSSEKYSSKLISDALGQDE